MPPRTPGLLSESQLDVMPEIQEKAWTRWATAQRDKKHVPPAQDYRPYQHKERHERWYGEGAFPLFPLVAVAFTVARP